MKNHGKHDVGIHVAHLQESNGMNETGICMYYVVDCRTNSFMRAQLSDNKERKVAVLKLGKCQRANKTVKTSSTAMSANRLLTSRASKRVLIMKRTSGINKDRGKC
jgi:hypothetical protein